MNPSELKNWFDSIRETLETSYLAADEPWKQSGFSGPYDRWEALRRPIADCVESEGSFLDIGCANGYLLECLLKWTGDRGISFDPWGLDISEKLADLAKGRLPLYASQILTGNSFYWKPPVRFDYVRTELCYVPDELRQQYVDHIIQDYLNSGGKLLAAEYRSRSDPSSGPWVDDILRNFGYLIESCESGYWDGMELTRIAVVIKL